MREERRVAELERNNSQDSVNDGRCSRFHRCNSSPDVNGYNQLCPYDRANSGSNDRRKATKSSMSLKKLKGMTASIDSAYQSTAKISNSQNKSIGNVSKQESVGDIINYDPKINSFSQKRPYSSLHLGKESMKNLRKNRDSEFRPTQTVDNFNAYDETTKKGGSLAQL